MGFTALAPAVEVSAAVRVEISEVRSEPGAESPVDPLSPEDEAPVSPEPVMVMPELEDEEEEPESGAQAKLMVLGTPSWMGTTLAADEVSPLARTRVLRKRANRSLEAISVIIMRREW